MTDLIIDKKFLKITWQGSARISILIVFLVLIRCIGEFLRLYSLDPQSIIIGIIQPFLLGALVCTISCFTMTLLLFFEKNKWIVVLGIATILVLLLLI